MGLRFEAEAISSLDAQLECFTPHPVFKYKVHENSTVFSAIPDGLALHPSRQELTIIEIKLRHSIDAWAQLFNLYVPVVSLAFPGWKIKVLEICKWYDPDVKLPIKPFMVTSPSKFIGAADGAMFGVIAKGRSAWT